MNEYLARNEVSAVDRAGTRAPAPVQGVQPRENSLSERASKPASVPARAANPAAEEDTASVAEYAKVHARIADILADMRAAGDSSVEGAEATIQSMLPAPIILVPLPPASKEAVEHAAALAKRIAQQANYAHLAQAHLKRGTVDQILATVA
ncbi:MAG: hypothetical protein ABW039_05185 [Sphingobium sp.]